MKNLLLAVLLGLTSTVTLANKPNTSCDIKLGKETYKGNCVVSYNTYEKSWMVFGPNDTELFEEIPYLDLQVTGKNTRNARTMIGDELIEFGTLTKSSSQCFANSKLHICYSMK